MISLLDDFAVLQDDDLLCIANGAEPVRNDDACAATAFDIV